MSRPNFLDAPHAHLIAPRTASQPLPSSRDHAPSPDRFVGYGLAFVAGALVALITSGVVPL